MFPRKTKRMAPENQWLERRIFLLNQYPFSGSTCCVFVGGGVNITILRGKQWRASLFFPNNKSNRSFITIIHSTLDLWFGPWVHFSPEKPNNETPDKWGPPGNKGEIDSWKGDLPPLVWRFLCTVTSWWMTSQPTCPQTLTYLFQKQGFRRPSYRKPPVKKPSIRPAISIGLVRYICVFQKKSFSTSYLRPVGGIRQKKMSNPMTRHQIIEVWKKSRWNQRRVALIGQKIKPPWKWSGGEPWWN